MPTETETLAAYIEAARLMGEVTGESLLDDLDPHDLAIGKIGVPSATGWPFRLKDRDARDLIESRVWRAVRGYCSFADWRNKGDFCVQPPDGLNHFEPDLPSAVAAIHKHWKESQ